VSPRAPRLPPAERRRRLLDAALEVVDARGFHGLTVEAVARRAGVTRPVVYDLFGDLGGLLLALAEREEAAALATLAAIVPADPAGRAPDELLVGTIESFLAAVRRAPRTWRLVLRPPEGTPPALRARITDSRRRLAEQVTGLLDWGLAERGGPHGLDHEILARLLIAAAEDAARLVLAHPRRFPPSRIAAAARGMLALLPPERT
jgi:AcrR family transcriptional regulator